MPKNSAAIWIALLFTCAAPAFAGQLVIDAPDVGADAVSIPIRLDHTTTPAVGALSFELHYDADVFEVDEVAVGAAAAAAGKDIQANLPEPGRLVVLILGLNVNEIANGVVADIDLGIVEKPATLRSTLTIAETILTPADGSVQLPSEGDTRVIEFQPDNLIALLWSFIARFLEFFTNLFG